MCASDGEWLELGRQTAVQRRAMGVPRAFQFRAVLLLGAVITLFREVGGSPGLVGAKAVRVPNLALRGGRPVTRFDENAKAVDIIMRDRLSKTARPTTETEETVAEALWRGSKVLPAFQYAVVPKCWCCMQGPRI